MQTRIASIVSIALLLSGCANLQPVLTPTAPLDTQSAYVGGLFTRAKGAGLALVLQATDGKSEYVMPIGEDNAWPTNVDKNTVAIKIPPGTYSVTHWFTYATLTKEATRRQPISNPVLSRPFVLKPGSIVHLGSYAAGSVTTYTGNTYNFLNFVTDSSIRPLPATQREVRAAFAQVYPNLAAQPFRCLLCTDTVEANLAQ